MVTVKRRYFHAAALVTVLAALAGCGSSSGGSSSSTASSSASASSQGGTSATATQATQLIAAATKLPAFSGPTAPVDMSKLKGKRVMILVGNSAIPFVAATAKGATEAANAAGIGTVQFDGKGQPSGWSQGIQQAATQGLAGVFMVGVPPTVVKGALAQAASAKVPVVDAFDLGSPSAPLEPHGLSGSATVDYHKDGSLLGDYIVANDKSGSPHVLVIGDSSFPSVAAISGGAIDELKRLQPSADIIQKNIPVANLATGLGSLTQTELRRDPNIKWIVSSYDAEAIYIVPAVKQAGDAQSVQVVGHDAVPQNLKWVQTSDVQTFDVGDPATWGGWAGLDSLARAILGMPQQQENIPTAAFTKASLAGKNPDQESSLFGTEYRNGYMKLWGLQ